MSDKLVFSRKELERIEHDTQHGLHVAKLMAYKAFRDNEEDHEVQIRLVILKKLEQALQ